MFDSVAKQFMSDRHTCASYIYSTYTYIYVLIQMMPPLPWHKGGHSHETRLCLNEAVYSRVGAKPNYAT